MNKLLPFYSQRVDESNYKIEEFPDLTIAKEWTDRICGLACMKMIIAGFTGQVVPLWTLLQEGLKIGAYRPGAGWVHQGLVTLGNSYGVKGSRESIGEDIDKISNYLREGETIIASVSGCFDTKRQGGHLVVTMEDLDDNFLVHHPSSWKEYNWPEHRVEKSNFKKSFSAQGNIIRFF